MVPRPLAPARAMRSRTCADVIQPCRHNLAGSLEARDWCEYFTVRRPDGSVGPSLVLRPSLRETTSGLPRSCCCCNTKSSWSSSGVKSVFIELSILFESSVPPDMVSEVGSIQ